MADLEPAELFRYGRPVEGAFMDAVEMREYLTALARTHYTTDADNPNNAQDGQPRFNAVDPDNVKLEFWLNGAWRTALQGIDKGIAAPVKSIAQFDTAGVSWVIDHNLGSQPLVQVYDSTFQQLRPGDPVEDVLVSVAHLPFALLSALPAGPTVVASFLAPFDGLLEGLALVTPEGLGGGGLDITADFTIDATPVPGASVNIVGPAPVGSRVGSTGTAPNTLVGGLSLVELRITNTTPPASGSFDVHATVKPTGACQVLHVNENRVIVTHPIARTGFVVLVG